MSFARETTLTFFIMYLSPLMSEVYFLVNCVSQLYVTFILCYLYSLLDCFHIW